MGPGVDGLVTHLEQLRRLWYGQNRVRHRLALLFDDFRRVYVQRCRQPLQCEQFNCPTVVAPADGVDRHPGHCRQLFDGGDSSIEHGKAKFAFADSHFLLALLSVLWYVVGKGLAYPYYIPDLLNLSRSTYGSNKPLANLTK